jgi:hypothetical protein
MQVAVDKDVIQPLESPMSMNKNLLQPAALPVQAGAADSAAVPTSAAGAAPSPKRGFKPRWLRLQRRERKLKEARALALRPVVG